MFAPLAILRAEQHELGSTALRLGAALALSIAAVWVPVAGEALAAEAAPNSPTQTDQFPAALMPPYPDANDPAALGRWFGQTTHLPAKSILAITDNAIFAAFPQHTSGPLWTVDVRLESITPQSTEKLGGRSIRLRLNVRCDTNTVRLNFLDAYPGADLTGAPIHRAPVNDWALPKPNSYVADAVRLACDKTFKGPLATIAQAARAPKAAPMTAPKTAAKPEVAAASTEPLPALRDRQPLTSGGAAVQIGAYGAPGVAEDAWRALKAAMPDKTEGLSNATTRVEVGGRIFYRAIVQGFTSSASASAFCQTLRASGRACLVVSRVRP